MARNQRRWPRDGVPRTSWGSLPSCTTLPTSLQKEAPGPRPQQAQSGRHGPRTATAGCLRATRGLPPSTSSRGSGRRSRSCGPCQVRRALQLGAVLCPTPPCWPAAAQAGFSARALHLTSLTCKPLFSKGLDRGKGKFGWGWKTRTETEPLVLHLVFILWTPSLSPLSAVHSYFGNALSDY